MSVTTGTTELLKSGKKIAYDTTPRGVVSALCENTFGNRLFNPLSNPRASEKLQAQREAWRLSGHTVVLTQGVFDIFHINHSALLQYSRISAVPYHYNAHEGGSFSETWDQLTADQQFEYTKYALSNGAIKQIVSIDGNDHVSARKNGDSPKPGTRPVYDWETRARDTLLVSAAIDGMNPQFLVDAVTIHDGVHSGFADTPHAGVMQIGRYIEPDVWAIHCESQDIIDALSADTEGRFERIQPVVLTNRGPYVDRLAGDISTSGIVERMAGSLSLTNA